jgi:hypothetical protein
MEDYRPNKCVELRYIFAKKEPKSVELTLTPFI